MRIVEVLTSSPRWAPGGAPSTRGAGKAVKTLFLCNYLDSEGLRREIHEGLNVVENWNSANGFIWFGKGGEIATNRLEDQEVAMLLPSGRSRTVRTR
jgi:TnpA family transposase